MVIVDVPDVDGRFLMMPLLFRWRRRDLLWLIALDITAVDVVFFFNQCNVEFAAPSAAVALVVALNVPEQCFVGCVPRLESLSAIFAREVRAPGTRPGPGRHVSEDASLDLVAHSPTRETHKWTKTWPKMGRVTHRVDGVHCQSISRIPNGS